MQEMNELLKQKLYRLLQSLQVSPVSTSNLSALKDLKIVDFLAMSSPVDQILEIYRGRGAMNVIKGSPIKGFDELLPRLELAKGDVAITHMASASEDAMIFTDAQYETLYGILILPPRSSAKKQPD